MLTDTRVITHHPVVGQTTHDHVFYAKLVSSYEARLKDVVQTLQKNIPATAYGKNREAWLIGEQGTTGDYEYTCSLHIQGLLLVSSSS